MKKISFYKDILNFEFRQYFNTNQSDEIKEKQVNGENDNYICYLIRNSKLILNNATLTPSLFLYAIHGNDAEIIELIKQKYTSEKLTRYLLNK